MTTQVRLELADLIEAEACKLDADAEQCAFLTSLVLSKMLSKYQLDCYQNMIRSALVTKIAAKVRADAAFREAMSADDTDPHAIITGLCFQCGRDLASREPGE